MWAEDDETIAIVHNHLDRLPDNQDRMSAYSDEPALAPPIRVGVVY